MPDIGATLREARVRARIDIAEIETATKIRAKYLRALENEEWELLPGPTFVKTFLRTYAEALGLDAKLLVEEYKLRHERLADSELRPIAPRRQSSSNRGARGGSRVMGGPIGRGGGGGGGGYGGRSRVPVVLVLVVLVIAILVVLGVTNKQSPDPVSTRPTTSTPSATASAPTSTGTAPTATSKPAKATKKATRRFATLQVLPSGDVDVCLKAKGRGTLIGTTLRVGDVTQTFKSSRFTLALGNTNARLRVNGKTRGVPPSSKPVGFVITPAGGARPLAPSRRPVCGP